MIECIFTVDYELFGNGEGSLKGQLYEPLEKLNQIFQKYNSRFVIFVEVAELEMIEEKLKDPDMNLIFQQVRKFYTNGYEIGLHIHPWWYNAKLKGEKWVFNYNNYNLCKLDKGEIKEIVNRALSYLNKMLNLSNYIPISFRAGHLIFQPTQPLAGVLAEKGIKIDSSVYKGGIWHHQRIDYRGAIDNGYYWRFSDDASINDPNGILVELPIYTKLVYIWKIFTKRRILVQKMDSSVVKYSKTKLNRIKDYLRFKYPLKFDFCEMNLEELINVIDEIKYEDQKDPSLFRPIVAIGHTKEISEYETIDNFLSYLKKNNIKISTFEGIYPKCY